MKLQITITDQEEKLLAERATALGYDVTKYAKFVLGREAFEQSSRAKELEGLVREALEDDKKGKSIRVKSLVDLLD